jgi:hypothetical protein
MRIAASLVRRVALLSILAFANLATAATVYTDRTAYLAAMPTTGVATFEDVPVNTTGTFTSNGISTSGLVVKDDGLVFVPYSFWFGTIGSPTHFGLMSWVPFVNGFRATFPSDAIASGFIFNCFACANGPNDTALDWATLDASGNVIESSSVPVNFTPSPGEPPPGFLGIVSTVPFRTLRVERRNLVEPSTLLNWMVDDIRYTAASSAPPPTIIPTLNDAMLVVTALALLAVAFVGLRKREGKRRQ